MALLGVIGGSGLYGLNPNDVTEAPEGAAQTAISGADAFVETPWGLTSGPVTRSEVGGGVAFVARHGTDHSIAPHRVNYRANVHALSEAGCDRILAVSSVGGIGPGCSPGALVLPHQLIDYTWGREMTFQSGNDGAVVHVDFTQPYDAELRARLLAAARATGEEVIDGAVYAVTQGPRLETAAEINRLEGDGADIVGMTAMPEAGLARELDLPYAAICLVANWAAGRHDSAEGIRFENLEAVLQAAMGRVRRIIEAFAAP